jgi:hypothetical protein
MYVTHVEGITVHWDEIDQRGFVKYVLPYMQLTESVWLVPGTWQEPDAFMKVELRSRWRIPTTRAQRVGLKRVYDRSPVCLTVESNRNGALYQGVGRCPDEQPELRLTYREFRALAHNTRDGLMVPWMGMWLGIEKDGYTHS